VLCVFERKLLWTKLCGLIRGEACDVGACPVY